jgi:hypothetical protein
VADVVCYCPSLALLLLDGFMLTMVLLLFLITTALPAGVSAFAISAGFSRTRLFPLSSSATEPNDLLFDFPTQDYGQTLELDSSATVEKYQAAEREATDGPWDKNPRQDLESDVDTRKRRRLTANVRETGYDSVQNYMKTICSHELLNKNEEIILAREIQILVGWEKTRDELESELLR